MAKYKQKDKLLDAVAQTGGCYRSDLLTYATYVCKTDTRANTVLRQLEKDGLLYRRQMKKNKKSSIDDVYEVELLTKKGLIYLLDTFEDDYEKEKVKETQRPFMKTEPNFIRLRCLDSRLKLMCMASGVKVLPKEKPSLPYMVKMINDKKVSGAKEGYKDDMTYEECEVILKEGVVYSIAEVRAYLDQEEKNYSDVTYRSVARGIFLTFSNIYVIYMTKRGNEKAVVFKDGERNLMEALENVVNITNVKRTIPTMSHIIQDGETTARVNYANNVDALVISGTDSLVSTMANEAKNGKLKPEQRIENRIYEGKWINASTKVFESIYCTPYTNDGINAFSYLCTSTKESRYEESLALLSGLPQFRRNEFDAMFPFDDISGDEAVPVTYMPVYDIKLLKKIHDMNGDINIVTYPDMYEQISKSVRKEIIFYDAGSKELKVENEYKVSIYNERGEIAGFDLLKDEMTKQGIRMDYQKMLGLHLRYGMTRAEFFNKIYFDELTPLKVISELDFEKDVKLIPKESKKRARKKTKRVGVELDEELIKKIKKAGKAKGMSVTRYVKYLVLNSTAQIEADSLLYKDYLTETED